MEILRKPNVSLPFRAGALKVGYICWNKFVSMRNIAINPPVGAHWVAARTLADHIWGINS